MVDAYDSVIIKTFFYIFLHLLADIDILNSSLLAFCCGINVDANMALATWRPLTAWLVLLTDLVDRMLLFF